MIGFARRMKMMTRWRNSRGEGGGRSYFVRLLRSLVSCLEIEIMRHRLLGIVIGSRATAVAIISHYYCYRSPCPTPPLLSSPSLFPCSTTDIATIRGTLGRPMEITRRVNLTLDLVSECASVDFFRFERFETGGWWLLKFYAIPSPLIFVRSLEVGGSLVPILLVILNWKCWNETERWWRCVRSPVWSNLKLLLLLCSKLYGMWLF